MSAQPVSPDPDQAGHDTHTSPVGSGDPSTGTGHRNSDTQAGVVGSGPSSLDPDQPIRDTQRPSVGSGDQFAGTDHGERDTRGAAVGSGSTSPDPDHRPCDSHTAAVGSGDQSSPSHRARDTQPGLAGGSSSAPAATSPESTPKEGASRRDADLLLYLYADQLNDDEALRVATQNRIQSLLSQEEWGKGVNPDLPAVQVLQSKLDTLQALEDGMTRALEQAMRDHYLADWQQNTRGVGEKTLARLLAQIGDPATRDQVSQLWSYCGLAGHGQQTRPGWNREAGKRLHVVAQKCLQAGVRKLPGCDDENGYDIDGRKAISHYGQVYLDGRTKYADAVHNHPCKTCTPKGEPAAPIGSEMGRGHQDGCAMRLVKKEILRDLWKAA